MKITRNSMISNTEYTLDLDITEEQVRLYNCGALLQDAFPNLNADEREFFKTGITKEEWDAEFSEEEDDEPDHDDMFDIESALGSAGMGTDEYYGDTLDGNGDEF